MDGALNPLSPEGMACLLKAFAQPLRLRILNLLVYRREICSCHLAGALHVPNNAVLDSLRHPKKLSLIHARRDGGWVIYSLAPTAAALFQSLHECLPVQGGMLAIFREDREKLDALPPCTPLALPTLHRSTARPNRRLA
jgi:ArsR family transcriptional regulator